MQKANAGPTFWRLAFVTALLTWGLIVFGAVVRVTDSGLGCNNHWPLCNGSIFPPLDNLTAWIEWSHRLFALLIGLCGIGMLVMAWRGYWRKDRAVFGVTVVAALLYLLQSALGAIVVILELPPTMVTLHLGVAMLLFGALLTAAIAAYYTPGRVDAGRDQVTTLAYINASLSLVIILTGALVRGSGATLACVDWPLCNGAVFPFNQSELAMIHMIHRLAVVGLGLTLVMLVWLALRERQDRRVRALALWSFGVYLAQAGVGALFVWSGAAAFWGAAHVGMAALTWGLLVALSVIETLNNREIKQGGAAWTQQSETMPR